MSEKKNKRRQKIAIVGCAGVPAAYGGFETLAENLAIYREKHDLNVDLEIFCSESSHRDKAQQWHGAQLRYLPFSANGIQSIAYDSFSLALVCSKVDVVLLLGVSGAIVLPILRYFSRAKVVTNIDGIEWRRAKWGWLARMFLHFSEWLAVRYSHVVVADNEGVAEHVLRSYGRSCTVVAYGGDHAVEAQHLPWPDKLPVQYALAICRIEPENNVEMILYAFSQISDFPLVFVGNWHASEFGRSIRKRYEIYGHIKLVDPEYTLGALRTLREGASLYVHGHSAGGTNPSLVEMMHFGVPIATYDCDFNRYTTDGKAWYFADVGELMAIVSSFSQLPKKEVGERLQFLAQRRYTWEKIGEEYFDLLRKTNV